MSEPNIDVTTIKIGLCQEGNTIDTTDEYEELEVEIATQGLSIEEPDCTFFTIKTETGWSVNDREEWLYIFDKFIQPYLPKKEKHEKERHIKTTRTPLG